MHELVKQAIIKAVSYSCPEPMLELLGHLYTSGQLSEEQLLKVAPANTLSCLDCVGARD